ncbi:succinoglycan biosynthesis protein exop [Novosphingobium profundi]|uniref:GumC family protein n=1 Tax=Novosphingobium profundi TaxID=1774954 RepID=UPI001BDA5AE6|nr:succinoglycan biosynthesis protein exop [Novosphingobium profundi]MBT0667216.1 succinoglycan biosynthesis protein exop [Novosphingobium profundi]
MPPASDQIGPRELVRLFHRYRAMILAIVGVITLGVLAQQLAAPPIYHSTSNVQVELIDEVGTNQADVNSRNAERVANAVRLHRSRSAAGRVIKDLDLLENQSFRHELGNNNLTGKALTQLAIDRLLDMLSITSEGGSDLIQIEVTSRSPELAADIANQLPVSVGTLRKDKLNERRLELLGSLKKELHAREQASLDASAKVADFRHRNRMLVGAGGAEDLEQINRIALQSAAANAARDGSAARSAGISLASEMQSTATATSTALDALQRQRGELVAEKARLGASLGPNHPDVRRVNSQLATIDASITKEHNQVQAATQAVARAEGDRMAQLARSEAAGAAASAARLQSVVGSLSSDAYRNTRNTVELGKLVRQSELAEEAYKLLAARVEQVGAQMQMEGVASSIVSPAVPNYSPTSPAPLKMTVTAFLGSTLVAFMAALTREFLDNKLRTVAQIRRVFGRPTLGMLPLLSRGLSQDPKNSVVLTEPQSLFAEEARSTYCEVRALRPNRTSSQVVLISSPVSGDGKSTVSLSLAAAGVAMGDRTVVLDLDLRKHGLLQRLQQQSLTPDLIDIVTGRANLDGLVIPHRTVEGPDESERDIAGVLNGTRADNRIYLLSAKEPVAEPAVLLSSRRLTALLEQLRERFDLIVVNAPAALAVRDARAMCDLADQTVLIARWGRTTIDQMRAAFEVMDGANIHGVIYDQVDYAEHARRRYGDAVQFYSHSSDYYQTDVPKPPTLSDRLRALFGRADAQAEAA